MTAEGTISHELAALCREVGVDISYVGWRGDPVSASSEAILALLAALGPGFGFELSPSVSRAELASMARAVRLRRWAGGPRVSVAWHGRGALAMPVRAAVDGDWEVELRCESGRRAHASGRLFALPATAHEEVEGEVWCHRAIALPLAGELGVHEAHWQVRGQSGVTTVISAPERGASRAPGKSWGVFAPLYGLRSARSGAAGDLVTLEALRRWVHERGGAYVGVLPMLAQFLDEAFNISPYGPASRLFWNELYLAPRAPQGVPASAKTQLDALVGSFAATRAELARLPMVDYRAQYAWKRRWIDAVAKACAAAPELVAHIERWAAGGPRFDYAMFRAFGEQEGGSWHTWKAHREGVAVASSLDDAVAQGAERDRVWSHVVAQWMMDEQLTQEAGDREHLAGLYLDLPVGVNGDAYEVWRHRELFASAASIGAPPDALFLGGQEWGLPPVHPVVSQRTGHQYLRACMAHHMRAAAMLRIDHVMGLHRLYCVPRGFGAKEGAYLRYPKDELYAILALESHRTGCALVGEDLGTVPDDVPPALERHDVARLWVSQFEMPTEVGARRRRPPAGVVASFGTHDMATFSGWWDGADVTDRHALGLIDADEQARQQAERAQQRESLLAYVDAEGLAAAELPDEQRALVGAMADLARGPADVVLFALEDLWLEKAPQNVPGTYHERPNWSRPFAASAEALGLEPSAEQASAAEPALADKLALVSEWARLRATGADQDP